MKASLIIAFIVAACLSGCVAAGPAVSKDTMGNLEVSIKAPQAMDTRAARIHVDGMFVGNISERLPVLYLKRGKHTVRVELEGTKTYEQTIDILGDPNHQVLNVTLEMK
jgi:PEGA domain-containing protein